MLLRLAVFSALTSIPLCAAGVTLSGRVVDENDAPVRAARVTVRTITKIIHLTKMAEVDYD